MLSKRKINKLELFTEYNGKALVDKNGKPYTRVLCQFQGDQTRYSKLSYNEKDAVRRWKDGDEVWVSTSQNGQYYNFQEPTRDDIIGLIFVLMDRVDKLEKVGAPVPHLAKEIPDPNDFGL